MPCYIEPTRNGTMFLCGDLGPHCADCGAVGNYLCDYPVGDGKTCDRNVCNRHAHEIAPNMHYCDQHYTEWRAFRDAGGVKKELENVMPFPEV